MPKNDRAPLVIMLANYPKGTGYAWWLMERYWNEITIAAAAHGWQSAIVYPTNPKDNDTVTASSNLKKLEAFLSNGALRDVIEIYLLIRHLNIRSIYLTDYPFRSWKYFLLRFSGVKSIIVHDHTPGDRPAIKGIKGLAKRILNSLPWITANKLIAISPLMRQRHILNARIPSSYIITVTNGIIVRDLETKARELLLKILKLTPDYYIVCSVGRMNTYKRFDFAIKCIEELAKENPQIKVALILVGDGPDRSRLEGIADSVGPNCKVIFTGQVDDTWPILCGVDTVIHPSAGEGLSLAILEAMAAAQPVIVPSLPSLSQTIEHGSNGLIYQEGSINEAKNLLFDLSTNDTLRETLGMNARHTVLEQYQLTNSLKYFQKNAIPVILNLV